MSKVVLMVGKKKTGKTTMTKKVISIFPTQKIHVFDPNFHYSEFNQFQGESIEIFMKQVYRLSSSVIVIEEATINFSSASRQKELQSLCVRSRHQNNFLILCFHSLRSVPTWLFDLTDAMYLFKTNDTEKVLDKFEGIEGIEEAFFYLKESDDSHDNVFLEF